MRFTVHARLIILGTFTETHVFSSRLPGAFFQCSLPHLSKDRPISPISPRV